MIFINSVNSKPCFAGRQGCVHCPAFGGMKYIDLFPKLFELIREMDFAVTPHMFPGQKTQWGTNLFSLFPIHYTVAVAAAKCQITVISLVPCGSGCSQCLNHFTGSQSASPAKVFLITDCPRGQAARETTDRTTRHTDQNFKRTCFYKPALYRSPEEPKVLLPLSGSQVF